MAFHFTLEQIDHALEWELRSAVIAAGYWPDVQALLTANADDEVAAAAAFAEAKSDILAADRPLVEVIGVGPWQDRGELRSNNIILSRLTTGRGTYGAGSSISYEPIDPDDLSKGYRELKLPTQPQRVFYDIRFISNDVTLDRVSTELLLATFGMPTYLYGLNRDFTKTKQGFEVMPNGDSLDLSDAKFIERVWRVDVLDVVLIPARVLGTVPAAVELGLDLSGSWGELTVNYLGDVAPPVEVPPVEPPVEEPTPEQGGNLVGTIPLLLT
jgi:hypothetical protein